MSLVTTCPECKTAFILLPEHLAAHRGDVRCGKCNHLFNALEHLAETDQPIPEDADSSVQHDEPTQPTEEIPATDEEVSTLISTAEIDFILEADPEPTFDSVQVPQNTGIDADIAPTYPTLIDPDLDVKTQLQDSILEPEPKIVGLENPSVHNYFLAPPSAGRRRTSWIYFLFALLLILGAAGQAIYFMRTEISVHFPQTKPILLHYCVQLGCALDLPRKIELLSIDDSDLQEDALHEKVVVLSATMINHAHFVQSYPKLELTLTDTNDRAVLRRLFAPGEYLPEGTPAETGMPADGEIHVKLHMTTGDVKAAGYRVFITY